MNGLIYPAFTRTVPFLLATMQSGKALLLLLSTSENYILESG